MQRSSVGSALACCKAGPSSNLGSTPQGGFSPLSTSAMRNRREASANGVDKCIRSASIFQICGINRLHFALIFPIFGINRVCSASIFRICGINRIRFALIFLRCRISRVHFTSIFKSSGISRFVSLRYRKQSQGRSFVPPSFRYCCHYYPPPPSPSIRNILYWPAWHDFLLLYRPASLPPRCIQKL
jgi:hypothetical protein